MEGSVGPVNQFALVIYIPEPLGTFLDELRRELAPGCNPRAHISVLPPRPLRQDWRPVCRLARAVTARFAAFEVETGALQLFPQTQVLYLELGRGAEQLKEMHAALNGKALEFPEPYAYHPHITVVQNVPVEAIPYLRERAACRWNQYSGPRAFLAESAAFVQNTAADRWLDLAQFRLGSGLSTRIT
ncbi:MAG: 2'-5' RNA ligase family protein [Bryobacteraceae bacterium]